MAVQFEHVETVGGNVMSGTAEGHEEEEKHRALEPKGRVEREGNSCQRRAEEHLHEQHPPALGLVEIHKGTPQGLYHPGKAEPTRVEGNLGVRKPHLCVHHNGDGHDDHIGKSFADVD